MSLPLYVLLPDGVEWSPVPGTVAQSSGPVRWYLRQHMVDAATQTAVLVEGDEEEQRRRVGEVAARAQELGGMTIDAGTQATIEAAPPVRG
jgi:hypothetical protein